MTPPTGLWSAAVAADADAYTMDSLGVPSVVLMERAALCVVAEALSHRGDRPVVCLVGPGNNGADALAVARILRARGLQAHAWLVTSHRNPAAEAQLAIANTHGVTVHASSETLPSSALWIDGLLGTGARGVPRGAVADALQWVAEQEGPTIAIDIPSGVNVDTGAVPGVAFRADVTVTVARSKAGLHVTPGRDFSGSVVVADIGVSAVSPRGCLGQWLSAGAVARTLEGLGGPAAHKGQRGHVAVLAGSPDTPGAAHLCGVAAMRVGAGLCTLVGTPVPSTRPELMRAPAQMPLVPGASVLAVGPGLTVTPPGVDLGQLYREDPRPAVWDATALDSVDFAGTPAGPRILTPHPGEAARMLARRHPDQRWNSARVQAERIEAVTMLQEATGAVVVLKGAGTLVRDGAGLSVSLDGSDALATAGSGDVLAGCIAGLVARGLAPGSAAEAGVCVHGRAGEAAAARVGIPLALDVAESLAEALSALRCAVPGRREPRYVEG